MRIRWLGLGGALRRPWQWRLRLRGHVGLLIGRPALCMWGGCLGRVLLPLVWRLSTLLPWLGLGIGTLLLTGMWSLALLTIELSLALGPIATWSLLSVGGHLLPIRHAPHTPRGTALHSHWISLGCRRAIALTRVTRPLLCPWGRPLLWLL